MKILLPFALLLVLLAGCRRATIPEHYSAIQMPPTIYPDYSGVTVPVNIAPLRFELLVGADEAVTRYVAGDEEIICPGIKVRPGVEEWKSLMARACGGAVTVEVYARKGERWVRFRPFQIHVSPDSIDSWLSYRLVSPSNAASEELTINQRCLENYEEQTTVAPESDESETASSWSPDSRHLYFSTAHSVMRAGESRFNIYRLPFDPTTRQFGERELVYDAAAVGRSATRPRLSPDGRWLLFVVGERNSFRIWYHDADLWMLDLKTWKAEPLTVCNSTKSENDPSWSSNGRWIVFSSRRGDGLFACPFMAHVDAEGQVSKPFELPTDDPDYHRQQLKSYKALKFINNK